MTETGGERIDDLMMGSGAEIASESDEVFAERLRAAQQKIAAIKKDEKKAKDFDQKLSKIIRNISSETLDFVVFLIDHDIPSLSILAMIAIVNDEAGRICFQEFDKYIEERADLSIVKFGSPKAEEKISYWWTFILAAEHMSTTVKFKDLRNNEKFVLTMSKNLANLLIEFLRTNKILEFDKKGLKKMLTKYEEMIFEE